MIGVEGRRDLPISTFTRRCPSDRSVVLVHGPVDPLAFCESPYETGGGDGGQFYISQVGFYGSLFRVRALPACSRCGEGVREGSLGRVKGFEGLCSVSLHNSVHQ